MPSAPLNIPHSALLRRWHLGNSLVNAQQEAQAEKNSQDHCVAISSSKNTKLIEPRPIWFSAAQVAILHAMLRSCCIVNTNNFCNFSVVKTSSWPS